LFLGLFVAIVFISPMLFEQDRDALAWYESQERVLNEKFLASIPWQEVSKTPLDPAFIPVLLYMRDVENFTSIYYDQLRRTPTGQDPVIRQFMDQWQHEETLHGDLLNRFLNEAGVPTSKQWQQEARANIPLRYRIKEPMISRLTRCVGKHFSAVHMTWGAINELSTLNGYQRLWELAKHPVLEYILRGIAREEAKHSFFYWSIARIKLLHSSFRQSMTRWIIKNFWSPVGQGAKRAADTNRVIAALFRGAEGVKFMEQRVNDQLERLPGLQGLKTVTERISKISLGY